MSVDYVHTQCSVYLLFCLCDSMKRSANMTVSWLLKRGAVVSFDSLFLSVHLCVFTNSTFSLEDV